MQQTLQAIIGATAALLAGLAVIGALAVLVLAEGYYVVGLGTRLYLRWKRSRRVRLGEATPTPACQGSRRGRSGQPSLPPPGRHRLDEQGTTDTDDDSHPDREQR